MSRRRISALHILNVVLVAAFGAGCQPKQPKVDLSDSARSHEALPYEEVLARWTRYRPITLLKDFNTTLRFHATLQSPEFNRAYLAKLTAMFDLPASERAKVRTELATEWRNGYPFLVVVGTHDMKWNDLDRKDPQWRMALADDQGHRVEPKSIRAQRRITETDYALLPHFRPFYRLYHVSFPKRLSDGTALVDARTKHLALRIAGPLGKTALVWRLR